MKTLKQLIIKTKEFVTKQPKAIIVIAFVGFLIVISGAEYARAHVYLSSTVSYKNSVRVLSLKDTAERFNREVADSASPVYCSFDLEGFTKGASTTDADLANANNRPGVLARELNEYAEKAAPSPAFSSLLQFLPKVRLARTVSQEMAISLKEIKNLTSEDSRSTYCLELVSVLSEVGFVNNLKAPQGVSALHIGQLDNFQANVSRAQDELLSLTPPTQFIDQHVAINQFLNDLRLDLLEDSNDYMGFAANISDGYDQLSSALDGLELGSADLLPKADQIALLLHVSTLN